MELSKKYFGQLGKVKKKEEEGTKKENLVNEVYQYQSCLTIYDETLDDEENGIVVGTPFKKLPNTFSCPVREAPKANFKKVGLQVV